MLRAAEGAVAEDWEGRVFVTVARGRVVGKGRVDGWGAEGGLRERGAGLLGERMRCCMCAS